MYTLTPRERVFTLTGILVGLFLGALDQTIVGTAMPRILQDLNGLNLYSWVVTAYLLFSTSMIPIYGKLSDLYGRKLIILIGILIFLTGSALSGQSRSMVELIAFRAVQGLGSAAIFSTAFTVIGDIFPPAERGKYQGLFGAVFGISSVIGPWLGGLLTDNLSWRWVFYVNLPIGLIAAVFIMLQMPALRSEVKRVVRIDWWGSITLILGIVPLLLALTLGGNNYPWDSAQILGLFALGAAGNALFIWIETRAAEPIVPFDLFSNRTYVIGNIAALLVAGVAFFGAVVFLPIFMVLVVGVSASQAGLTVTPLTLGVVVGSFLAGQIVSRLKRYKVVVLIGVGLTFVGYLLMQGISSATTQAQMTWRMIILGLGIGPSLPVFTLAIQNAVHPHELGAATSSSQFFRQIGSTMGVAVFGTILTTVLTAQLPKYLPAEMRQMSAVAGQFNAAQLQSGNIIGVGDQIKAGMQGTYQTIQRALADNDPAAVKSLLDNPQVPAGLKDSLRRGGIPAKVRAGLDARYAAVAASFQSGRPDAVAALISDPRLPAGFKDQLRRIAPAALSDPRTGRAALQEIRAALYAQEPLIVRQATQDALKQVKTAMDTQAETLTAEITSALKHAFTDAIKTVYFWGLFVVALGFLVTLFLPELALRAAPSARIAAREAVPANDPRDGHGAGEKPLEVAQPAPADKVH